MLTWAGFQTVLMKKSFQIVLNDLKSICDIIKKFHD